MRKPRSGAAVDRDRACCSWITAARFPRTIGRRGEIPTRIFSELRRVGNGTLILEGSSFLIHCGNTSYSYSAGDMDQILFQGSGLALVPIHPDRPIPLFLTTGRRPL